MEIVAHRGASHDAPENTLAAVNLAWEQGADAVEIDVRLTRDGHIVAVHDETTLRCGGRDRRVAEQTLAELSELDVGSWKHPQFADQRIPTLERIIETIPEGHRLFVEVKCGAEIVPVLNDAIRHSDVELQQIVPIGFDLALVTAVKRALPECDVSLVATVEASDGAWSPSATALVKRVREAGLDGLDVGPAPRLDASFVELVRGEKLAIHVWTVDDAAAARQLGEVGVDGITTNRPGWLRERCAR